MSVQILSHLMENFVSFLSFFYKLTQTVIMLLTRIEHWREMHQVKQVEVKKIQCIIKF